MHAIVIWQIGWNEGVDEDGVKRVTDFELQGMFGCGRTARMPLSY